MIILDIVSVNYKFNFDFLFIRDVIYNKLNHLKKMKQVIFSQHALEQLADRGTLQDEVEFVIRQGEQKLF